MYLWGGNLGKEIAKWLLNIGITPKCFCDNDVRKIGRNIEGIPCISFDELNKIKDSVYVIVGVADKEIKYNQIINEQLKDFPHIMRNPLGITVYWTQDFCVDGDKWIEEVEQTKQLFEDDYSRKLYNLLAYIRLQKNVIDYEPDLMGRYYYSNQYLVRELIDFDLIHTVIDCGAYTGDSLDDFMALNKNMEYWCYEMDSEVYQLLSRNVSEKYSEWKEKIHLYPYGVGRSKCTMSYTSDLTGGSKLDETAFQRADIIALDDVEFSKKIDFIKMDIEGAEEDAIEGAKYLIKKDHPTLAISMYHNMKQFVEIPKMIKKIDSHYRIYLRHHKNTIDDTVCYAIYA